jgi:hypothetical protein
VNLFFKLSLPIKLDCGTIEQINLTIMTLR